MQMAIDFPDAFFLVQTMSDDQKEVHNAILFWQLSEALPLIKTAVQVA